MGSLGKPEGAGFAPYLNIPIRDYACKMKGCQPLGDKVDVGVMVIGE
jgi:hypothetical protein